MAGREMIKVIETKNTIVFNTVNLSNYSKGTYHNMKTVAGGLTHAHW